MGSASAQAAAADALVTLLGERARMRLCCRGTAPAPVCSVLGMLHIALLAARLPACQSIMCLSCNLQASEMSLYETRMPVCQQEGFCTA